MLTYDKIFEEFLSKVDDPELLKLSKENAYVQLSDYLKIACQKTYIRKIFNSLENDAETQTINYEVASTAENGYDEEFIIYALSEGMVVAWMKHNVDKKENFLRFFGGKEEKTLKDDYKTNKERLKQVEIELKKEIRDRAYVFNQARG